MGQKNSKINVQCDIFHRESKSISKSKSKSISKSIYICSIKSPGKGETRSLSGGNSSYFRPVDVKMKHSKKKHVKYEFLIKKTLPQETLTYGRKTQRSTNLMRPIHNQGSKTSEGSSDLVCKKKLLIEARETYHTWCFFHLKYKSGVLWLIVIDANIHQYHDF